MSDALRELARADLGAIPKDPLDFLAALGVSCAIHVPGRDPSRTRAVVTLLHGNEPSGARAIHAWLRSETTPATNALLVLGHVDAALAPPGFAHRMLPGRPDLNRLFHDPPDDAEGRIARGILATLRGAHPEAIVDVHNNSGHNPPYGVARDAHRALLEVVSLFADRLVTSRLRLGALMEVEMGVPSATIEVGRSGDPAADAVALSGLERFLERETLFDSVGEPLVQVLEMTLRVELDRAARLVVGTEPHPESGVFTLHPDLDRHNFERVAPGTPLGWWRGPGLPLHLRDVDGGDHGTEYFEARDGRLLTTRTLVPIMITTDPVGAAADCLFYVVRAPE